MKGVEEEMKHLWMGVNEGEDLPGQLQLDV
jgi:hypothetical protein